MAQEQRIRIEKAMGDLVDDVDKHSIRDMQADMHRCALVCCQDKASSAESVQRCITNCSVQLEAAQNYLKQEFEVLQDRFNRCVLSCQDKIRDQMGPNPSDTDTSKYARNFELCAKSCVDAQIDILSVTGNRIKQTFSGKEFQRRVQYQ